MTEFCKPTVATFAHPQAGWPFWVMTEENGGFSVGLHPVYTSTN